MRAAPRVPRPETARVERKPNGRMLPSPRVTYLLETEEALTSTPAADGEGSCELVTAQHSARAAAAWLSRHWRPSSVGISRAKCHQLAEVHASSRSLTAQERSACCHRKPCGGSHGDLNRLPERTVAP